MAKRKKAREQQTVQEDAILQELLMEVQALAEQRQDAVRWQTLMHQRFQLERPLHYERLARRAPTRPEESTYDHHRGTHQSRRRRLPH